jgi:hypothetical protein
MTSAAAGTEYFFNRFTGCIAAVAELEEVPLVCKDGIPELGPEHPIGSEKNKQPSVVIGFDLASTSDKYVAGAGGSELVSIHSVTSPSPRLIICGRENVG